MQSDIRRAKLTQAASELFSEKGLPKTSINDITSRAGVTRSLFYHYFEDKQAAADAVIDDRVNEFVTRIINFSKEHSDISMDEFLLRVASFVRSYLSSNFELTDPVMRKYNEPILQGFTVSTAQRLSVTFMENKDVPHSFASQSHTPHPRESFYLLAVGLVSLMIRAPQTSDEVIASIIADNLRMENTHFENDEGAE
ncbi:MAG: TetR/AcrR family transcriptional regulator [Coriobacteriales bacterium]|nr:TetR/AcrR family transcriptional regulator [Coriobacteriales bacterium]